MIKSIKTVVSVLFMLVSALPLQASDSNSDSAYSESIPSRITSSGTLKELFSNSPRFKCSQTGVELTLSYDAYDGFVAYVDGKRFGKFEVDTREDQPKRALIGLPWLNGYDPAPMLLTLNGNNTTLELLPVQGEENLSYNSSGYLQHGRTGNTTWMKLSLSSSGISFTPVNYKPDPEIFRFIDFNKQGNCDDKIYGIVDQQAEFPGGSSVLWKWIGNNLKYPESAMQNGIQGRIEVKFIVEKDGSITNPVIYKGVDKDLDREAIRLVRKMPKWRPAKVNGVSVRSYFFFPVVFKMAQ